ncbi:MAG: DUF2974 domain-containing protein [Clostridia bacterium]|nr:DUF2974 domain-containing protein [Clostridia bacterium]
MLYQTDELLFLEHLTYMTDVAPFHSILDCDGMTVGAFLHTIDRSQIEDGVEYSFFMNGFDWKNVLLAMDKKPQLLEARIAQTHLDKAYGGGGGVSVLFLHDQEKEAVVAFRGTSDNEWLDDFLGANQVDSLQQINAMEWFKKIYEQFSLQDWDVTVIGHSKGGNKAKYIAVLSDLPKRCVAFDGQGFSDEFMEHYSRRIQMRQGIIENHNIDFDYVNILLNDIGRSTYYYGYDYGKHGFAESHGVNTFFDFGENGEYTMRVNPNGQRPEMQALDQFINSMVRSGLSQKEKEENNALVGMIVEKGFGIGTEHTIPEYINFICDLLRDPQYSDNTAYLLAFTIKYSRQNPHFLTSVRDIMHNFQADNIVRIVDMLQDLIDSQRLSRIINLSDFLIHHVSGVLVKQVQALCQKKYGISLSADQIKGVLQIVCMTKDMLKNLIIDMDGADRVVTDFVEEPAHLDLPEHLQIVVLAGGLSNERNLSLRSGYLVSRVLAEKGHHVILLDSFMGYGDKEEIIANAFENPEKYTLMLSEIPDGIPDLWAVKKRRADQSSAYFGPNVLQICRQADLVFIALHGAEGENGKVQATFDLLGIDYTGSDYFSSALSSNKSVSKQLLMYAGIPVPKGFLVSHERTIPEPESQGLTYPVIIKPNNGGIGLGISVANDKVSYQKALKEAFRWENELIVEEYVTGREFAVGFLDGKALPVIEVLPLATRDKAFGKSLRGDYQKKCPADIPEELARKLQETAEKVSDVLGVVAYGKVDFIVRSDQSFVCLECDSLPQLYRDAHLLLEAQTAGMSFDQLYSHIMEMSLRKK